MTTDESKLEVLRKVEEGKLSIEEGAHLLEILDGASAEDNVKPEVIKIQPNEKISVSGGWRALWGIILWIGTIFVCLTGFWLYSSYGRSGLGVGFWFALFFLLISFMIVYLGYELMASKHWLLIRVHDEENEVERTFNVWVPLPIQLVRWFIDTFGSYFHEDEKLSHLSEILSEIEKDPSEDEPYIIELDGENQNIHLNVNIQS